jgi:RNase H-fold protein (predicted Holliday junction resolvase)
MNEIHAFYFVKHIHCRAIMGLNITRSRVAVAIARHPTQGENCIQTFDHLRYQANDKEYSTQMSGKERILQKLHQIALSEKVCGVVVGWPLEKSGYPGSRCGHVLHLLDYLSEKHNEGTSLINQNARPLVLWDERIFTHQTFDERHDPIDKWGRCQSFAHKNIELSSDVDADVNTMIHTSSLRSDHSSTQDSIIAENILQEYMKMHSNVPNPNRSVGSRYSEIIENIESEGHCLQSSLL